MSVRQKSKIFLLFLSFFVLLVSQQNCTSQNFEKLSSKVSLQNSGNGGPYEGKPDRYAYYDLANSCRDRGADLKALPNKEIFLFSSQQGMAAQLVRDNCADLAAPLNLTTSDFQISGTDQSVLTYSGYEFKRLDQIGDFDVVASACPAGMQALPGVQRQNLLANSQDLFSSPWIFMPGVQGALNGSLGSLPKFEIRRSNASALEWYQRVLQPVPLTAGKNYAFTFFAQKGTVSEAYVSGWHQNNMALNVFFDLNTGAGRDVGSYGFSNLSFGSRAFSGGFLLTVYFTAPITDVNDLGVTAAPPVGANGIQDGPMGSVGDSIFATALQLEDVSHYCQ